MKEFGGILLDVIRHHKELLDSAYDSHDREDYSTKADLDKHCL